MKVSPQGLQQVKALSGIPVEILGNLAEKMDYQRFINGQEIVVRGQSGDSAFFILDGEVEVLTTTRTGKTQAIATLKKGTVFGQVSLLAGIKRTATCVAKNAVLIAELKRKGFNELLDKRDPGAVAFLEYMVIHLAKQLRSGIDRLNGLSEQREAKVRELRKHFTQKDEPDSLWLAQPDDDLDLPPVIEVEDDSLQSEEVKFMEELKRIQMNLGDFDTGKRR